MVLMVVMLENCEIVALQHADPEETTRRGHILTWRASCVETDVWRKKSMWNGHFTKGVKYIQFISQALKILLTLMLTQRGRAGARGKLEIFMNFPTPPMPVPFRQLLSIEF